MASPAFTLNLGKSHTLHIKSGGILTTGDNVRITGRGKLPSLNKRTLYIHTYGDKLTLEDQATLGDATNPNGNVDLVKTENGTLTHADIEAWRAAVDGSSPQRLFMIY